MRNLLKLFALLDVVSILFMGPQLWTIVMHYDQIPQETFSLLRVIFTVVIFLSLFVTAAGQFQLKRYGVIAYYIQFPFRLVLWVFSIGFITFLPEMLTLGEGWFHILFRTCMMAEFFRLYFVVRAQQKLLRSPKSPLA